MHRKSQTKPDEITLEIIERFQLIASSPEDVWKIAADALEDENGDPTVAQAMREGLYGTGSGSGSGFGHGTGNGSGSGSGSGTGSGSGNGSGNG